MHLGSPDSPCRAVHVAAAASVAGGQGAKTRSHRTGIDAISDAFSSVLGLSSSIVVTAVRPARFDTAKRYLPHAIDGGIGVPPSLPRTTVPLRIVQM